MTPTQRHRARERHRRYAATERGRVAFLKGAYRKMDACDLGLDEMVSLLRQPCHYCGTTAEPRGLDRIDNSKAHVKGNVLPACAACNIARGDRLTVAEMVIVGKALAESRANTV